MVNKESHFSIEHDEQTGLLIQFLGLINYSVRNEFHDLCDNISVQPDKCLIDLTNVSQMDSTGLGMLLILKDHESLQHAEVIIKLGDNGEMKELLHFHNFEQLFMLK